MNKFILFLLLLWPLGAFGQGTFPDAVTASGGGTIALTTGTHGNRTVLLDCTGGDTVTVPSANPADFIYRLKRTNADGTGNCTIDPDGSETIDGSATYLLTFQYQVIEITSDGTNWVVGAVVGEVIPSGSALPATCTVGEEFFKTTAPIGMYVCLVTNRWALPITGLPSILDPTVFTGSGLDDLTFGGTFTGSSNRQYCVQIDDVVSSPDTVSIGVVGSCTNIATGFTIQPGTPITIDSGVNFTITNGDGHTLSDKWETTARPSVDGDGLASILFSNNTRLQWKNSSGTKQVEFGFFGDNNMYMDFSTRAGFFLTHNGGDLYQFIAAGSLGDPLTFEIGSAVNGTGILSLRGITSGSAKISVPSVAGSPNTILLPTATAAASGHLLSSDGGNPQQLSWVAPFTLPATVVRTDQSNTYTTGAQSFAAATSLTIPVAAGAAPTANGIIAYDSTANEYKAGYNGTGRTLANLAGTQTFTNKTLTTPVMGAFTVAGLPAAGTANRVAIVTDSATAGSCTSGGGSARAWCRDTGAAWEPLGDGGGGGGLGDPGGNGVVVRTALNTTINRSIAGTAPINVANGDGVSANPTVSLDQAAAYTWTGLQSLGAEVRFAGVITPAQITSDQSNYDPSGNSTASALRLSSDASRNISGLAQGNSGTIKWLANVGTFNIVLQHEQTGSSPSNRFLFPSAENITIPPDSAMRIQYDATSSRWRLVSRPMILAAIGTAGIAAFNQGAAVTAARSDHTHRSLLTLQWFFPGAPSTGVQPARSAAALNATNCTILNSKMMVNTAGGASSSYNIQRCTAGGNTPCTSTANIYGSAVTLAASNTDVTGGAPTTATITAGDPFRVDLVSVGSSAQHFTVQMTYKCESID
jgi:hypothetical protein